MEKFGNIGQRALRNVLAAYSVKNPQVGYCQSMNFMVGFLLMVSGSREKECFWVFNSLVSKNSEPPPFMDGLTGFYESGFPMTFKYIFVFQHFFKTILPELQEHFA